MIRQTLIVLAIVFAFGVWLPWQKGPEYLTPFVILCYACLSIVFAAPAGADLTGKSGGLGEIARLGLALVFSVAVSALILGGAVATTISRSKGYARLPEAKLIGAAMLLSAAASLAVLTGSALLSRRFSPGIAKMALRAGLLAAALWLALSGRLYLTRVASDPAIRFALIGSAVLAAISVPMLALLVRGRAARG